MAGTASIPRSRGAVSGLMLILLGAWGGLAPFIGPYFRYGFAPDRAWAYTEGRLVLSAAPGAIAVLAGLIIMLTRSRGLGVFGGFLAALAGAWFIVGVSVVNILPGTFSPAAVRPGFSLRTGLRITVLTQISFWAGTGALIIFFGALAIGRFSLLAARDAADEAAAAGTGYGSGYATGQFPSVQLQYPAAEQQGYPAEPAYPAAEQEQHPAGADHAAVTQQYEAAQNYRRTQEFGGPAEHAPPQYPAQDFGSHQAFPGGGDNPITHEQFPEAPQHQPEPAPFPSSQPPFPPAPDPFRSTDETRPAGQQDFPPHGS